MLLNEIALLPGQRQAKRFIPYGFVSVMFHASIPVLTDAILAGVSAPFHFGGTRGRTRYLASDRDRSGGQPVDLPMILIDSY
ncbi:MAG: hypothetical protein O3B08_04185 [Proteobacteria bacterium]|nr:hypothetical protein [Pseudomonadota bacterium]